MRAWVDGFLARIDPTEHDHRRATPTVSVLLACRRPDEIMNAVRQVAGQVGVRVELVVGLHGPGFDPDIPERIATVFDGPLVVEHHADTAVLGDVLASLSARASAELITKWDDDDWYGTHHLLDLVLAYDYSGCDVVGKRAEFVYLEASDITVRRSSFGAESVDWSLAGGTLLTSSAWLKEIGGWSSVPKGVDRALLDATRAHGGKAYRTHGYQYVLKRAAVTRHTWDATDSYFLDAAEQQRPGLDLRFADIEVIE